MPQSFTIECPSCAIRLHCLPSASGKRLQCPQCQTWMMVPDAPATAYEVPVAEVEVAPPRRRPQPRDEFAEIAEIADFGSYEMYLAPPRPRRRKPAGKKEQAKWVLPVVIAGSCVLGLLFVGVVVYGVMRQFNVATLETDEPLAYLTVGTEVVVVVNHSEMRQHPGIVHDLQEVFDEREWSRDMGIALEDIERCGYAFRSAKHEDDLHPNSILRNGGMLFIQSKRKLDRFRISLGEIKARHAGKEYLKDAGQQFGVTGALFFPDEKTLIIAAEPTVTRLLEADTPSIATSRFRFVNFDNSIIVAHAGGTAVPRIEPRDKKSLYVDIPRTAAILGADLRGLALCSKFGNDVQSTAYAVCADSREANRVAAAAMQSPEQRRALVNQLAAATLRDNPNAIASGLENLRITTSGSVVEISTRFPSGR